MFGSSAPAFGTLPPSLKHVVVNGFTYLSDFRPLFDLLATKPDQVSSIFLNTTGPTVGNLSAYPQLMTKLKRAVVPLHDLEPLLPALAGVPHLEITHVPTISRPVPGLDSLQLSHLTLRGGEYSCIPFGIPRKLGTLELNSPHPRLRMIRSSDIGRLVLNDCETDCIRQGLPAGLSTLELRHPKPTMKLEDLAKAAEVLRAAAPKKVVIRGIPRSEDAAHWQGRVHEFWFWNGIAEWKQ
ncbi:hypothetical protein DFJ74DRAFT_697648 [Hyaloraphidium curvatum]|nr:hypothetical protein DFJ74DRAFT_697648 [Hyaloraphidium curvatum]